MKSVLTFAAAIAIAATLTPAAAETSTERTLKAPEKTMGDEGKLPPTEQMSTAVPDMGSPEPGNEGAGPSGPRGPPKRMGDEGKLPATNNMSGQVREMTPDASK